MNNSDIKVSYNFSPTLLHIGEAFTIFFMVFGVVGNVITIIGIMNAPRLRNAASSYIISLSVADLFFCLFNLPFSISLFVHGEWIHGDIFCILTPFFRYANVGISLLSIAAITINRYILIVHRSMYDRLYRKPRPLISVIFLWLFSYAILMPTLVERWGKFGYDQNILSCTILSKNGKSPKTFLFVLGFVLPCVVIIYCYVRILYVVKKSHLKVEQHRDSTEQNPKNDLKPPKKKDWFLIRTIFIIFLTFVVCYLPVTLVKTIDKKGQHPELQLLSYLLVFMSASVNPAIYALSNRLYRQAFKYVIICQCKMPSNELNLSSNRINASNSRTIEIPQFIHETNGRQTQDVYFDTKL